MSLHAFEVEASAVRLVALVLVSMRVGADEIDALGRRSDVLVDADRDGRGVADVDPTEVLRAGLLDIAANAEPEACRAELLEGDVA